MREKIRFGERRRLHPASCMQQEIGNDGIVLMLFRELTVDQAFPNESRQYSAYRLYTPCCRRPRPLPAATRYVAASAPSGADR